MDTIDKEKLTRDINLVVQPSLFIAFSTKCKSNYTTISETIRQLMIKYVNEDK